MFFSKKARNDGILEGDAKIFGPSVIGQKTLIGDSVIIGYPIKRKIIILSNKASFSTYDDVSEGTRIGADCIIRSGTIIYESSQLGNDVETGHNVLVREKTVVGDGTRIGTHSVIDGNVQIGNRNNLQTGVYIPPGTSIGSNIFMGPFVTVTNDKYPPSPKVSGVTISDNAIIGCRSVLIAGIKIGEEALVGAGSVVTKDVPPRTVVLGVPARKVMTRDEYDRKQKNYLAQP
ncbi:MAG: N-acetyltransferase [Candidatus Methanosuratus sp.]|nr:N-acetyltransferase [Candidatus Methanosuratincola sp.]